MAKPNLNPCTVAEAARRIGVSRWTVTRLIAAGTLTPTHKLPGKTGNFLLDPAEIERYRRARALAGVEVEAHPDDLGTASLLGRAS